LSDEIDEVVKMNEVEEPVVNHSNENMISTLMKINSNVEDIKYKLNQKIYKEKCEPSSTEQVRAAPQPTQAGNKTINRNSHSIVVPYTNMDDFNNSILRSTNVEPSSIVESTPISKSSKKEHFHFLANISKSPSFRAKLMSFVIFKYPNLKEDIKN
jgi:hypothetical protein